MASLGKDLATIRKQRQMTLEDVHNATKIPPHILEAIEDDTIFTEFTENKTYIRSYVRSYGKAVKLDDERVVEALNKVESGSYDGDLLREEDVDKTAVEQPMSTRQPEPESQEPDDMVHDHAPDLSEEEEKADDHSGTEGTPPPPSVDSVDWADMGRKFTPLQTKSRMWIGIVVIIMIVAAVVFFWIYQNNPNLLSSSQLTPETTQNLSQPGVVPDSLQLNLSNTDDTGESSFNTDTDNATVTPDGTLPDTLGLLIYAAYGKLEPVRVYTDVMEGLNPYWIEEGEAFRFEFVNIIRIRGQYSRMELLVNGHPIRNFRQRFYDPDTSMVVIERTVFEDDDRWLQPPPDSSEISFLPPSIIRERPIFN